MNNIQLSNTIKALCKAKKITIKTLLESCQISRNFIYDLEKKGQIPSIDKLESIADYLDCSVDYLLGRKITENSIPENLQELITVASTLSSDQLKELLQYVEFIKLKNKQ